MLRDSTAAVVRTRPRAIPLAMRTMRKSSHGFPFVSHIWVAYGAPLGGPWGRRSSAIIYFYKTTLWDSIGTMLMKMHLTPKVFSLK